MVESYSANEEIDIIIKHIVTLLLDKVIEEFDATFMITYDTYHLTLIKK